MRDRLIACIAGRTSVCAVLAALVFFCRAWLIRVWGSPLPFWDQWDAEAIGLYGPWLNGTLHWQDLFRAHNEHRIVLTRLADLALFIAYDGWNPWAQLLLNASLHAATAAALAALFWSALSSRSRVFFITGVALLFTATCGWQNALYGFQSQVYFANLLTVGVIAGLGASVQFRTGWWLGLLAAFLIPFSNGGGLLAVLATLTVGLVFGGDKPRTRGRWMALSLIAAALAVAILFSASAPQHTPFHAQNIGQFFAVLTHCLAWPWINQPLYWLVMQLPLAWMVFDRLRRQEPFNAADRCALAFGLFAVMQAAAVAYTRGGVLPEARPLSRYQDPLLLGAAGQLFAVTRFFTGRSTKAGRMISLVWSGVALGGLIGLTETNFVLHLPFKRTQDRANLAIVRAYANTGDPAVFSQDPNFGGPHPDPRVVQHVIDDPTLRSTLPKEIFAVEEKGSAVMRTKIVQRSLLRTGLSGAALISVLVCLFLTKPKMQNQLV